jgi:hypothetical protein
VGPAAAAWKDGRYSKYVPKNLLSEYQNSVNLGDDLLSSMDDIALIEARVTDLLKRLGSGESGDLWRQLRGKWDDFMTAVKTGDSDAQALLAFEVGRLISRGAGEWAMWGEIGGQVDRLSRLRQSERKREAETQVQIPLDIVLILLGQIVRSSVEAIRRNTDESTAKRVIVEINSAYQSALGPGTNR